ncbi:DUF58 domain-containing protein [Actibacterium lipolyticum]|uniref:DUF58 domain-containing protein n=1 Tax=Actibacterium lipolyticum TaxID=1524263 RepID=A0A238KSB7_9RHOB|nr:DUF58 domain-containing protein [Actibacterium lipolyticum]SMX44926.1 hypothetical protein COL8621_02669 [Actibacterium lipolyticum]
MTAAAGASGSGVTVNAAALIAQRAHVQHAPADDPAISALPGGFLIKRRGNGQVIADSRAYVEGDDIRHVDRGATARTGKLHIRTFHEERDRVTFLVADFRPSMLWGVRRAFRSVAAAEALARLGWQAIEAGGRVGLLAITAQGTVVVPVRGRVRGMLAVIGGLVKAHEMALAAAADDLNDPQLDRVLVSLKRVVPSGAAIVIATGMDRAGVGLKDILGELALRRFPRLLIVEEHALRDLPAGYYPVGAPDGSRINAMISRRGVKAVDHSETLSMVPVQYVDAGAPIPNAILQLGL